MSSRIRFKKITQGNHYTKGYTQGLTDKEKHLCEIHAIALHNLKLETERLEPYDKGFKEGQGAGIKESRKLYYKQLDLKQERIEGLEYIIKELEDSLRKAHNEPCRKCSS